MIRRLVGRKVDCQDYAKHTSFFLARSNQGGASLLNCKIHAARKKRLAQSQWLVLKVRAQGQSHDEENWHARMKVRTYVSEQQEVVLALALARTKKMFSCCLIVFLIVVYKVFIFIYS